MSFKITIECEEYYGNGQYTSTLYVKGEDFFDALGRFVKNQIVVFTMVQLLVQSKSNIVILHSSIKKGK